MRLPPALALPSSDRDAAAPARDSDAALLAAFAAGDTRAFERLYARHEAALYRFVRRLLGREAAREADEVFQDTWMRAIQARQQWRDDHAAGARFRTGDRVGIALHPSRALLFDPDTERNLQAR